MNPFPPSDRDIGVGPWANERAMERLDSEMSTPGIKMSTPRQLTHHESQFFNLNDGHETKYKTHVSGEFVETRIHQ